MARDKRTRHMDQPARSALNGLAAALAAAGVPVAVPRQPDEFTADEAAELMGKSGCTARKALTRLIGEGKATRRPVTLNATAGFLYRLKG